MVNIKTIFCDFFEDGCVVGSDKPFLHFFLLAFAFLDNEAGDEKNIIQHPRSSTKIDKIFPSSCENDIWL